MNSIKLPIGATVNEAFQFGFTRIGTTIRYGWAPVVASLIVMVMFWIVLFDVSMLKDQLTSGDISFAQIFRFSAPVTVIGVVMMFIVLMYLFSGFMTSVFRLVSLGEDRRVISGFILTTFFSQQNSTPNFHQKTLRVAGTILEMDCALL